MSEHKPYNKDGRRFLWRRRGLAPAGERGPRHRDAALLPLRAALERLLHSMARPEQAQLIRLWQHWDMVMGEELAALAQPLGTRGTTLLIAGEDTMVLQELTYMTDEILERVNAFMGSDYFTAVKVSLLMGKRSLAQLPAPEPEAAGDIVPWGAPLTGEFLSSMPADSPVTRCYASYVAANAAAHKG